MKLAFILLVFMCMLLSCSGSGKVDIPERSDGVQESDPEVQESESNVQYIAALTGMNLREEPSKRGKVIQLLPYGSSCEVKSHSGKFETIDGLTGEWVEVIAGALEGFIFSGYTLPIPLPGRNPSTDIKGYFSEHMIRIGNEETSRMTFDPKTNGYKKSKIPEEKLIIETESDKFEKRQEYAGGYYFAQEIGYEYEAQIGFLPGISLQDGYLLARAIYPSWGYEGCKLNLGKLDMPADDKVITVSEQCHFQIKTTRKDGKVTKLTILNDELGYHGLEITDTGSGIEINTYYAL